MPLGQGRLVRGPRLPPGQAIDGFPGRRGLPLPPLRGFGVNSARLIGSVAVCSPTMLRDDERTLFPTDYDAYASTYAWTRRAVPWVLQPLIRSVGLLAAGASVLEIGCGTGNYISALAEGRPDLLHFGFDLSEAMLTEARGRASSVVFVQGDASHGGRARHLESEPRRVARARARARADTRRAIRRRARQSRSALSA